MNGGRQRRDQRRTAVGGKERGVAEAQTETGRQKSRRSDASEQRAKARDALRRVSATSPSGRTSTAPSQRLLMRERRLLLPEGSGGVT